MRRHLLVLSLAAAGCASARDTEVAADGPGEAAPDAVAAARIGAMSDADAWARVPRATPPLPLWARLLVDSLPRTTALQLDLDHLHRTKNPLGPVLTGKLRWTVADANRCGYAKESAESDLVRASVSAEDIGCLGEADAGSDPDRLALVFARKLTLAGSELTDQEVADLIAAYGPDDAVAIVHTVAHANFQNRIFLALGATSEPGGAAPPREIRPTADATFVVPERPPVSDARVVAGDGAEARASWSERTFGELRDLLEAQKARKGRIEKPSDPGRLARIPRPYRERMGRVAWGSVSMGYQPILTGAWFQTMEAFADEAKLEHTFSESVFWIVTRTNDCFY